LSRRRWLLVGVAAVLVAAGLAAGLTLTLGGEGESEAEGEAPSFIQSGGYLGGEEQKEGGESAVAAASGGGERGEEEGAEPELLGLLNAAYLERAYPLDGVGSAQAATAEQSFSDLPLRVPPAQGIGAASALGLTATWRPLGPKVATALPGEYASYKVRPQTISGRVTTILLGRRCVPKNCRLWLGTAGGGVFRTDDALAETPLWAPASAGLTSSAIGFLARDPSDATGQTIYVGTGEPNSSSDSEAGVGVFRSANGGNNWALLAGSPAATAGSAVSGIVVDPRDPQTIYVSTTKSVHGRSSVFGGQKPPPGAPQYGVYRSTDGGASFSLLFSLPDPSSSGKTKSISGIGLDPNDPDTLYAGVAGEGLFRRSQRIDGDDKFHRVFAFQGVESGDDSRALFSLADLGTTTRIYLGSANSDNGNPVQRADFGGDDTGVAHVYRIDDASKPAAAMLTGWTQISSDKSDVPGYAAYRYCSAQCWYDNVVYSPPGQPNTVFLGGMFDYDEARTGETAGRAVLRSVDGGATFNDFSTDAGTPPYLLHPDVHAIAASPSNPGIAFIGTDGGLVRTGGTFADVSARCPNKLDPVRLASCQRLLGRVPARIISMNAGLNTLQLQSVSVSQAPGSQELLAGTQDNGTWSFVPGEGWKNIAGGDGGQSGVDAVNPQIRFHTYYGAYVRINFSGGDPEEWRALYAALVDNDGNPKERASFYVPLITDPRVGGTLFIGLQHVFRIQGVDSQRRQIIASCKEDSWPLASVCGNWVPLGPDLTGTELGTDRAGFYLAAVDRAPSDSGTLWAATLPGRVFVSKNADAPADTVTFTRIDRPRGVAGTLSTPGRFVSGIAIDPQDPNHAWISYSGYDAYTPEDEAGHVFEVQYDPAAKTATWTNRTYNLGDQPITDLARDPATGDLFASTAFGVTRLPAGATAWTEAAKGLPFVAVYGLTLSADGKTVYAATHGRGVWTLDLS
jgi:hypothetical protein